MYPSAPVYAFREKRCGPGKNRRICGRYLPILADLWYTGGARLPLGRRSEDSRADRKIGGQRERIPFRTALPVRFPAGTGWFSEPIQWDTTSGVPAHTARRQIRLEQTLTRERYRIYCEILRQELIPAMG